MKAATINAALTSYPSWQVRRLPGCVEQATHQRRHLEMSKTLCHQDSRAFISCSFKREFCKLLSWPQTSQHVSQLPVKPYLKHTLPVAFSIDDDFIGFPKLFSRVASALEWHESKACICDAILCDLVQRRKQRKRRWNARNKPEWGENKHCAHETGAFNGSRL